MQGPAVVTMIHFALPQKSVADPKYKMNRDTLNRIWWDGDEAAPSRGRAVRWTSSATDGPARRIDSALVNKKRGWNAYFPCPFRKSAKIALFTKPRAPRRQLCGA